ncbi:GEVED domain-containing protein [Chryseobacterium sp. Mn2064]|uniref:GEVED domain-containing protein n=1 Tax=Chryseobacterium sp. Mn2064 TaxID=3395263 RepID=UPI003BDA0ABB
MTKKLLLGSLLLLGAISTYQSKNVEETIMIKNVFIVPTNVLVSNITTTSAKVSWDPIPGSSNFTIRIKPVSAGSWLSIPVMNANSFDLTNLQACTAYMVQVMDNASGDMSSSVTFYTSLNYCSAAFTDSGLLHISNVTVNSTGISNPMVSNSGASNYTDYRTDPNRRIKLNVGSMGNNISVTHTWIGTPGTTTVTAWIDFNGNGVFESSERMMIANNVTQTSQSVFSVPGYPILPSSVIGGCGVVMRVISSQTLPGSACGTFTYGEVEDYGVDFLDPLLAVQEPGKFHQPEIYPNPASDVLNISGISDAVNFEIYNAVGQKVGEGKVSNHQVNLQHLSKGIYYIQLKNKENTTRLKFIKK